MHGVDHERVAAPGPRRKRAKPNHLQVKTYIIMRRVFNRRDPDRPNVEVLDVKLNLEAARAVCNEYAGTWIVRAVADKLPVLSDQSHVQRVAPV